MKNIIILLIFSYFTQLVAQTNHEMGTKIEINHELLNKSFVEYNDLFKSSDSIDKKRNAYFGIFQKVYVGEPIYFYDFKISELGLQLKDEEIHRVLILLNANYKTFVENLTTIFGNAEEVQILNEQNKITRITKKRIDLNKLDFTQILQFIWKFKNHQAFMIVSKCTEHINDVDKFDLCIKISKIKK